MSDIVWTNDTRKLSDLVPWQHNPKRMTKKQAEGLRLSIERFGFAVPFLVSPDGDIYDGHQRQTLMAAIKEYGPNATVDVRVSSRPLTDDERRELVVRLKQNQAGWDFDMLPNLYEREELLEWGFEPEELGMYPDEPQGDDPGPQIDKAEELRERWGVETGQLWQLGEHRLICGDCTDAAIVAKVMQGEKAGAVIIDPPYSSGGFQEADKSGGSIGTRSSETIQRDNLSTRGYRLLLLDALANFQFCDSLYIFTDWRMWIECFDIAERAGWKVRSMLVWDKEQMGMGLPWRSQHELILYGKQTASKILDGKQGNVLHAKRTGNVNHPTEKPVDLIEQLIGNTDSTVVIDFFLGSGTTLIACERLGRRCRAIEISPAYCAVAIQRWVDMTGGVPVLLENNSNGKQ